ncbi:MAG: Na+/H+ antiporter subunit D [Rhodospirillales bacterium]|nr:Na+/H+ antiporter subunit D [Rhodospirillales bacterium]
MGEQADIIAAFVLIPLVAGLINLAVRPMIGRVVGTVSLAGMVALSVVLLVSEVGVEGNVLVSQMAGWRAPFGISLVFDSLSGLLVASASMVALGAFIHSFSTLDPRVEDRYYHPLFQMLMFGVNLSFLTGDLFNLFVAFEIMLMASYALLVIGGGFNQLRQAYKYVILNLLASTIFVMAAGMTYGMFGTLNMADLARIISEIQADPSRDMPAGFAALGVLFLLVFGLKGAFFPMWFWLPDTYWTTPISIGGLFGGMLTKVGVYAVLRTFPMIFAADAISGSKIQPFIAFAAIFTMFLAVLGAVSHHQIRRILSVHVISQVGYMVFGIAVGCYVAVEEGSAGEAIAAAALAGCLFYMIQHMVVKCALFLCCGLMERHTGSDDLDKIGGLLKRDIPLAVLFFIAAMSLVGLPPLSGFFGKMVIIQAGWKNFWWLSIVGLLTGALTLLSMLKIWSYGFWYPEQAPSPSNDPQLKSKMRAGYVGITLLVCSALFLGFGAESVYKFAFTAGEQLRDPRPYVSAVLGEEATEAMVDRAVRVVASEEDTPQQAANEAAATQREDVHTASATDAYPPIASPALATTIEGNHE